MATLNIKQFPDDLHRRLRQRALRDRRSVAQEVVQLLSEALAAEQPTSILALRGLGAVHFQGVDAAALVQEERDAWT